MTTTATATNKTAMNTAATDTMMHEWRIEEAQYARHEQRRGRRHAWDRLDPTKTALLVIDMVPFFLNESAYARGIVSNIERLAETLRANGGTVAWVLPSDVPPSPVTVEYLGPTVAESFRTSGGTGTLREKLWHEFVVDPSDILVEKRTASAFFPGYCDLKEHLDARGIENVLITGTVANVCCESTARDACVVGYRVVMVADANAAMRDQDLNATLHTFYRTFGDVRPTAELVDVVLQAKA